MRRRERRRKDKRRQGFQAEGGRAIIKSRTSDNGREGGVGMKGKNKGNMVQDDKTRSVGEASSKRVVGRPNKRTLEA